MSTHTNIGRRTSLLRLWSVSPNQAEAIKSLATRPGTYVSVCSTIASFGSLGPHHSRDPKGQGESMRAATGYLSAIHKAIGALSEARIVQATHRLGDPK